MWSWVPVPPEDASLPPAKLCGRPISISLGVSQWPRLSLTASHVLVAGASLAVVEDDESDKESVDKGRGAFSVISLGILFVFDDYITTRDF